MFEKRKVDLLNNKVNLLTEKELKLLREGKIDEANKVSKEIDETSKKIIELSNKLIDKTNKKVDKTSQKIDKNLKKYENLLGIDDFSDEEVNEKLDSIMRG